MMTANAMPVFLAAGTALFVVAYPQPKDFTESLSERVQYEASAPLVRMQADTTNGPVLALLRTLPEGSTLDRLYNSGCIQDVDRASPDRLGECGVLIADAIVQIEVYQGDPDHPEYPDMTPQSLRQTNEYLRLAALNVCRGQWLLTPDRPLHPVQPACTTAMP